MGGGLEEEAAGGLAAGKFTKKLRKLDHVAAGPRTLKGCIRKEYLRILWSPQRPFPT